MKSSFTYGRFMENTGKAAKEKMRIKLDGELFRQEEMEELVQELEKKGVGLQTVKKGRTGKKGILDEAEIISWIAIIADVFLPVVVDVVYNYIKTHKKEKALIDIEQKEADGQKRKITVQMDQELSSFNIQAKENGDIHIFVTKA